MINARDRADYYRGLGMEIEEGSDEPGKIYPAHAHERTVLYTVAGSLRLEREGVEAIDLLPGTEAVVDTAQRHTGVVGPEGWSYIAAWDPEEAKQFNTNIMRKSTVTTAQDTAGTYETEIFDCPTPKNVIIGVHGNGVRRWDGEEFFYQLAEHYADSVVVLADLNQQQDNGVQINPLPVLTSRVQRMIDEAHKHYPDVPIILVGHSMGCGVITQLDMQNIKAVFFVTPAVGTPQAELIQRYGPEISQGKTVVSSDGLTKIITASYFDSVAGINWDDEYIKLVQRFTPVYVYEAGADEILDERRYAHRKIPFTSYDIIKDAKHNFSGQPLNELFNKMDPIIERLT